MSPTLSVHATYAGVILGTAAYMSPEQARGKPVDRRTDIWAFGCVLFEMLTGRQAFDTGETVSDAIAAILKTEVDWNALPPDVPDQIRLLLKRCLEKDRAGRIGDIGTARFLMTETLATQPAATSPLAPAHSTRGRSMLVASAGVVAGAFLAAAVAAWWIRSTPPPKLQPMRFAIVPPATLPLAPTISERQLVVSPDGTRLVYVAGRTLSGGGQLMVRTIDQIEAVPLRGITNAHSPFMSPDGRWIAYFDTELKKVSITGGPPISLCRLPSGSRGGSWGPDDTIVFDTANN
jgi:serine/threonine-protein kinase